MTGGLKRPLLWAAGIVLTVIIAYMALLIAGFMNARDVAYFEAHAQEHRKVLEDCRSGGGWFPECEAAEAIALR
jgi:hypothetical protein